MNKKNVTNQTKSPNHLGGAVISRFLCSRIVGHKVDISKTDSGYLYCQKCNSHEYYDNDFDVPAMFLIPFYIKRYFRNRIAEWKYKRDKSNELPF